MENTKQTIKRGRGRPSKSKNTLPEKNKKLIKINTSKNIKNNVSKEKIEKDKAHNKIAELNENIGTETNNKLSVKKDILKPKNVHLLRDNSNKFPPIYIKIW